MSASNTGTPRSEKRAVTADLPEPMPPVMPMMKGVATAAPGKMVRAQESGGWAGVVSKARPGFAWGGPGGEGFVCRVRHLIAGKVAPQERWHLISGESASTE